MRGDEPLPRSLRGDLRVPRRAGPIASALGSAYRSTMHGALRLTSERAQITRRHFKELRGWVQLVGVGAVRARMYDSPYVLANSLSASTFDLARKGRHNEGPGQF
eukprot:COSAG05_NODE_473_length_9490_cov_16.326696_1_plen_105_part_00